MDVAQYYITTLSAAFKNLAPIAIFILGGWFVFIKLPFFFFMKSMRVQKPDFEIPINRLSDNDIEDFQRRMKIGSTTFKEGPKKERPKPNTEQKSEHKRAPPKREKAKDYSAEEIFQIKPGEVFSKRELKKKYHDLLKLNHPDKVGPHQKTYAELKSKEINSAYVKLKSKAA